MQNVVKGAKQIGNVRLKHNFKLNKFLYKLEVYNTRAHRV